MSRGRRRFDPVVAALVAAVIGVSGGTLALAFNVLNHQPYKAIRTDTVVAASAAPAPSAAPVAVVAVPSPSPPAPPVLPPANPVPTSPGCPMGYVALTFDDGPSPTYTNPLIDYLVAAKVPATFFVQGSRLQADPQPTLRAYGLGFTVGNHTWNHPRLTELTDDQIVAQLTQTADVFNALGIRTGTLMRSPYGADNPHIVDLIKSLGMVPVGWTDDSRDYADGNSAEIAARVLAGLQPHIFNQVLVHDGIDQAGADGRVASAQTIPAIPLIVDGVRAAGYCFTEFALDGHPMIPAPTWGPHGWVFHPPMLRRHR